MQVVWRAFELRPDPVPALDPHGEYLTRVWKNVVYPMAKQMGMSLVLPPVQPRSRLAHEAAAFARDNWRFKAYHEELFRAFFQRGEDIGKVEVLAAIAEKVELNSQALRGALEVHQYEVQVVADQELAESYAIRAVPAFVFQGRAVVTGVQTYEALRRLTRG